MRGFSTSDANECREAVVANSQRVAKEKRTSSQQRKLSSRNTVQEFEGSWKKDGREGRISRGQGILGVGVLVCR
jgi:hypothetical protein